MRAVWQRIVKMRQLAPMTRPMSESDGRTSEAIAVQTPGFRVGLRADTDRRGQLLIRRREGSWLLASHSSVWPAQCRPGHRPSTTLPRCAGGAVCCVQDSLKPVLNWANVCSPNILRTVRRTMICFLIELLVRRIWFGQSKLYFVLNWLVMRCKLRPEFAADAQQTA